MANLIAPHMLVAAGVAEGFGSETSIYAFTFANLTTKMPM
jgi:hypothetical protein